MGDQEKERARQSEQDVFDVVVADIRRNGPIWREIRKMIEPRGR